ncbi:MAG TPA: thiamine pyrophosphate-dependent enzyme [Vicinamibacterales bacterium]|nr:thiamine pyrophosphate-dependent enzyme [Vicinamibacterales bacterium]
MDNCIDSLRALTADQETRNRTLLGRSSHLGSRIQSDVLPFTLDFARREFTAEHALRLGALEKQAARTAIESLVSLAKANDIDHLGGGLELIPALLMTLAFTDYERVQYAIEHGHTSIGYYASLATLGFLDKARVVDGFRRSLDIAGHVSWVPGGTELSSGRLGVMMPVGAGLALGLKAKKGTGSFVICHTGDAGWISGQALDGFNGAAFHGAPIAYVMHRNGIQLSGSTRHIMNRDPRPIIASVGIEVLEIPSLLDRAALFAAYGEAFDRAQAGHATLIYPTGFGGDGQPPVTIDDFGKRYDVVEETRKFAADHKVPIDTKIWIPGSLMSFRDVTAMLQCLFYVNDLPGGEAHHDGGMKGRDPGSVLSNRLLILTAEENAAFARLQAEKKRTVITTARPARGTPNLTLSNDEAAKVSLPAPGKEVSARAGVEVAYAAVAAKYPDRCFFVSCDLDPSTKLGKATALVPRTHHFEMSIEEQAASLMADGLAYSSREPQINVFATFAAFFEGIAREGFEMWRYQRNLTGFNEGLNVIMHLSHVGACTGRDHFSGWSVDWINLALGYLPFLHRFYAPSDARSAFIAVRDATSAYGGHIVAIPRDNLPILTQADGKTPLWNAGDAWTPVTPCRERKGARAAILAIGAPSFLAAAASDRLAEKGTPVDVHVINGFPLDHAFVDGLSGKYDRILTIEDGLIGTVDAGLRGLAAFVAGRFAGCGMKFDHVGIADPQIAPSDHYLVVWEHYGMTADAIVETLSA